MALRIRPAKPGDRPAVAAFLAARHSTRVARRGELLEPGDHPALLAEEDGALVAVITYVVDGADCELLSVHAEPPRRGVGTALLAEAQRVAAAAGCTRLWLVTTNDNVDALRFYQRRGFALCALRPRAVDIARATLKAEIPLIGDHGIRLRDELELEKLLGRSSPGTSPRA
jgi:ribosomal protein S18 acetylase RimI-like enzyme